MLPVVLGILLVSHLSAQTAVAFEGRHGSKGGNGKGVASVWLSVTKTIIRTVPSGVLVAAVVVLGGLGISKAPPGTFQAYQTAGEIPARAFQEKTVLRAECVRVTDGDTVRVRHIPLVDLWGVGRTPMKAKGGRGGGRISEVTLLIRLAGVDAPETRKMGLEGQPFSEEATDYVKTRLLNKRVRVKLLRRDQYGRAVASLEYGRWPLRRSIAEDLVREGLAVVYRQAGAEYDGKLALLEDLEAQARARRLGLWSSKRVQLPSEYKAAKRAPPTSSNGGSTDTDSGPSTSSSSSSATSGGSAPSSGSTNSDAPPKRGRGRPRKVPVAA